MNNSTIVNDVYIGEEVNAMDLHKWNILNADKKIIDSVITFRKNRHAAFEKAYHKYEAKIMFCTIEYAGRYDS